MSDYQLRRERLIEKLTEAGIEAALIATETNRQYFSGFSGSNGWLFISRDKTALVTDGRYWAQVEQQCPGVELIRFVSHQDGSLSACLANWLKKQAWAGKLAFEGSELAFDSYLAMKNDFCDQNGPVKELISASALIDGIRLIKSTAEMTAIAHSAALADQSWREALKIFAEGITEADFCAELEYQMQKAGARKPSFDTIVASGPNGAYPHATVTNRKIVRGEMVTVDFGCLCDGYCSDITRTIWLGNLDEESLRIWNLVRQAHDEALVKVRPGVRASELDGIARGIISAGGCGEAFSHSLGHGVGLAIHEGPGLRKESAAILAAGMTVTIEPGIYIPGIGGCRIEDLLEVTAEGYRQLSLSPYQVPGQSHPLASYYA